MTETGAPDHGEGFGRRCYERCDNDETVEELTEKEKSLRWAVLSFESPAAATNDEVMDFISSQAQLFHDPSIIPNPCPKSHFPLAEDGLTQGFYLSRSGYLTTSRGQSK